MIHILLCATALCMRAMSPDAVDSTERALHAELVVHAPVSQVWDAWTTEAGIRGFFAPDGRIEPRVDGAYSIYFNSTAAPGVRGVDDMRILLFEPAPGGRTLVRFSHVGWGAGPEWDRAYAFFDAAWNRQVLPRLKWRFEHGPVDWAAPPADLPPAVSTLRATVAYQVADMGGRP